MSDREDKLMARRETGERREKQLKDHEDRLRELHDSLRRKNLRLIGVAEGPERDRGPESVFKQIIGGSLGGAAVWRLPWAQGAILETRDRIPRRAPGAWSLLLPLPMSLPLSLSLSV